MVWVSGFCKVEGRKFREGRVRVSRWLCVGGEGREFRLGRGFPFMLFMLRVIVFQ